MTNAICISIVAERVTDTPATGKPAFAGLFRALARAFDVLVAWQRRAEARRHLRELDNRLLADVGLTRNDVRAETEKPFWIG